MLPSSHGQQATPVTRTASRANRPVLFPNPLTAVPSRGHLLTSSWQRRQPARRCARPHPAGESPCIFNNTTITGPAAQCAILRRMVRAAGWSQRRLSLYVKSSFGQGPSIQRPSRARRTRMQSFTCDLCTHSLMLHSAVTRNLGVLIMGSPKGSCALKAGLLYGSLCPPLCTPDSSWLRL